MKEIKIGKNQASQRLDKFLKRYFPEAGGGFLYKQLRKKNITLNGKKAAGTEMLAEGDSVKVFFSDETIAKFMGQTGPAKTEPVPVSGNRIAPEDIIFEDENVLMINKKAGILSQPADGREASMVELVRDYLTEKGELDEESLRLFAPSVVNRLDRNTSGLIFAAKTLPAARELSVVLKDRSLHKYYLALVKGQVKEGREGRAWLKKNDKNQVVVSEEEIPDGQMIETHYQPLGCVSVGKDVMTLIKVKLVTGKTHQIRSHLAYLGHPLCGDPKYGDLEWNKKARDKWKLKRQFLHAYETEFPEMKGELSALSGRCFRAPLPFDLLSLLDKIGMKDKVEL